MLKFKRRSLASSWLGLASKCCWLTRRRLLLLLLQRALKCHGPERNWRLRHPQLPHLVMIVPVELPHILHHSVRIPHYTTTAPSPVSASKQRKRQAPVTLVSGSSAASARAAIISSRSACTPPPRKSPINIARCR